MVVMILENVSPSLRGELTRWLIEPRAGMFVGHVSGLVRDRLWEKCIKQRGEGGVIQIWSTNTEQRFAIRSWGETGRDLVEFDGIWLIRRQKTARPSKKEAAQAG
jgi:CRISPR-associated protein Cas2